MEEDYTATDALRDEMQAELKAINLKLDLGLRLTLRMCLELTFPQVNSEEAKVRKFKSLFTKLGIFRDGYYHYLSDSTRRLFDTLYSDLKTLLRDSGMAESTIEAIFKDATP